MAFCKKCGKELKKGEKCTCESEVKFCKGCGKKLVGDETCDCNASKKTTTSTDFDFATTMKDIKDDMLSSIKTPVTVIKENTDSKNMPKTYILMVIIALTFGLFVAGLFKSLIGFIISSMGSIASYASSEIMDYIKVPYVKIIAYGTIIFAIMIAAYALIMLLVPSIFKNKKLSYTEALTLTTSAFIPYIWSNVICAILGFLGLSTTFVLIIYLVVNIIVTYNFAYSYGQYTKVEDNKFGYAIAVLFILSAIIVGICTYVVSNSMVKSIGQDMVDVDTDDLEDLFNYR